VIQIVRRDAVDVLDVAPLGAPAAASQLSGAESRDGASQQLVLVLEEGGVALPGCRVGSLGSVDPKVRIGGLNLKPLQNDLDRVAKNMIEDSATVALDHLMNGPAGRLQDRIVQGINDILEADCPAKSLR